ncbi:hypothetical protein SLEP1_g16238 [Rubroshorea leprosula]|uniref:Uncharacterized protein n=1 Tax=Rubroshorea leprosula TaxID=152421 RepID=A0AAV5IZ18_9ROSI|nr:hypothetical protein SLEP1_g16238 [Rubroshorea leprosula]
MFFFLWSQDSGEKLRLLARQEQIGVMMKGFDSFFFFLPD